MTPGYSARSSKALSGSLISAMAPPSMVAHPSPVVEPSKAPSTLGRLDTVFEQANSPSDSVLPRSVCLAAFRGDLLAVSDLLNLTRLPFH